MKLFHKDFADIVRWGFAALTSVNQSVQTQTRKKTSDVKLSGEGVPSLAYCTDNNKDGNRSNCTASINKHSLSALNTAIRIKQNDGSVLFHGGKHEQEFARTMAAQQCLVLG